MIRHRRVLLAVTLALLGAAVAGATAGASTDAKAGRLVAFRSCPDLLGYAKAQATRFVGPYGFGRPMVIGIASRGVLPAAASVAGASAASSSPSPQQGVDYSGTNVQEVGVDEPDIVKTDGKTLF